MAKGKRRGSKGKAYTTSAQRSAIKLFEGRVSIYENEEVSLSPQEIDTRNAVEKEVRTEPKTVRKYGPFNWADESRPVLVPNLLTKQERKDYGSELLADYVDSVAKGEIECRLNEKISQSGIPVERITEAFIDGIHRWHIPRNPSQKER